MKSSIYFFAFCIILSLSCDSNDIKKTCYSGNPLEELEWLTALIESKETSSIYQFLYITEAEYNNETVFILGDCCPYCNSVSIVYNCAGENMGYIGTGEGGVDPDHLENKEVVWKPSNSQCNFD